MFTGCVTGASFLYNLYIIGSIALIIRADFFAVESFFESVTKTVLLN
jgi:hypothetical protein